MKKWIKIFVTIFLVIFLVETVYAWDFDNTIGYSNDDLKVTFTNAFGIGEELGNVTLTSHNTVNEIRKVMPGRNRVVMFYEFEGWDLYESDLGSVEFTDLNSGKTIDKNYYFAEAIYETVMSPRYTQVCNDLTHINGTKYKECHTEISEYVEEDKLIEWKRLNSKDIPKEKTTIGLAVDVLPNEKIDGIWTIAGKKLDKHAGWTSSLNDNLRVYYPFNETSGTNAEDVSGNNENGTLIDFDSGSEWQTGLIGNAINMTTDASYAYVNMSLNFYNITEDYTWSFWLWEVNTGYHIYVDTRQDMALFLDQHTTNLSFYDGAHKDQPYSITPGLWQHIVYVYDEATTNITIYVNGSRVSEDTSVDTSVNLASQNAIGGDSDNEGLLIDELGIWNRTLTSSEISDLYNDGSGITYGAFSSPIITLNNPSDNLETWNHTITFNCSSKAPSGGDPPINLSLLINDAYNTTITNATPNINLSLQSNIPVGIGSHNWSCISSSQVGETTSSTRFFNITEFIENLVSYNATSYPGTTEGITINLTYDSSVFTTIEGTLWYNLTSYTGTDSGSINEAFITREITTPAIESDSNVSFHWEILLTNTSGTFSFNATPYNQTIKNFNLSICGSGGGSVSFINFTFKDEETDTDMSANVDSSTWTYWTDDASINNTYTFANISITNPSYGFCFDPPDRTINIDLNFKYSNTSYPQRTFVMNSESLTNLTTNQTLYLLDSSAGSYVTFQVLSQAEQPISEVYSTAERQIDGNWESVGFGNTGDDGGITFWVNPDYSHRFTFTKTGYTEETTIITPTQSTYTIYLGGGGAQNISDYSRGISYKVTPTDYTLINDTTYTFGFNLTSSYWNLDYFGFALRNGSGTAIASNSSSSGTGGNVSLQVDTGANETILMEFYWVTNDTSTNFTKIWYILDDSSTGWSIKNFFDDLKSYTDDEIFGLNEFSRTLLIFLFIFISVGLISYYSGVYSPAAILTMIFLMVALFDFGLGIIPNPVGAVTHFPTIFIALITIGVWIMEWRR